MHPQAEPKKPTPDVDIPVCPPRTGVNTASAVWGLGVEEVVVLEVRIGVATRTNGAGGGRLQANELIRFLDFRLSGIKGVQAVVSPPFQIIR